MPENDQLEAANLALFFDGAMTLSQTLEILKEVDEAYHFAASLAAPPGTDPAAHSPQVVVSTGSLFIELVQMVEPGAWMLSAIVFMKWLIQDGENIAKVPQAMRKSYFKEKAKADKVAKPFKQHRPAIDDEAYRRKAEREATRPQPPVDTPKPTPHSRPMNVSPPSDPLGTFSTQPFVSSGTHDGGVSSVVKGCLSVADFTERNRSGLAGLTTDVEHAAGRLNSLLGDTQAVEPANALRALIESRQLINNVIRLFTLIHDNLHAHIRRY